MGDIYHGWLDPDSPKWYFIRFCVMCGLTFLGVWGGIRLQQRFLRNYLHLKLFGYDDGMDPPIWKDPETKQVLLSGRDPIEDQGKRANQARIPCVITCTCKRPTSHLSPTLFLKTDASFLCFLLLP